MTPFFGDPEVRVLGGRVVNVDNDTSIIHRGTIRYSSMLPSIHKPLPLEMYSKKSVPVDFMSFVGILISKKAVSMAGLPAQRFFLFHDDVEYCIRLSRTGQMILVPASIIMHKENAEREVIVVRRLMKQWIRMNYGRFVTKHYYNIRNYIWIIREYSHSKVMDLFIVVMYTVWVSLGVLVFDDRKMSRICVLFRALRDGIRGGINGHECTAHSRDNHV